jgi:hypothetical protein
MDKVHKPSNSECYKPSLEPFRSCHGSCEDIIQNFLRVAAEPTKNVIQDGDPAEIRSDFLHNTSQKHILGSLACSHL